MTLAELKEKRNRPIRKLKYNPYDYPEGIAKLGLEKVIGIMTEFRLHFPQEDVRDLIDFEISHAIDDIEYKIITKQGIGRTIVISKIKTDEGIPDGWVLQ
ncbi:hypothetical protein FACS1894110_17100 [Spirochaetia bacterium]|nr:hypothetical protein FACS1894110_17100 [Spirochaetia bacterium]